VCYKIKKPKINQGLKREKSKFIRGPKTLQKIPLNYGRAISSNVEKISEQARIDEPVEEKTFPEKRCGNRAFCFKEWGRFCPIKRVFVCDRKRAARMGWERLAEKMSVKNEKTANLKNLASVTRLMHFIKKEIFYGDESNREKFQDHRGQYASGNRDRN